jgi:hypothetical protein
VGGEAVEGVDSDFEVIYEHEEILEKEIMDKGLILECLSIQG